MSAKITNKEKKNKKRESEIKDEKHERKYWDKLEILEKELEVIEVRHKANMEELEYARENARLFHERELEKIRIKSAEIRKSQERKANEQFAREYHR